MTGEQKGQTPFVIAIDGPAASGKSSTAHWVASVLRYRHVDSGALYRAATAAALRTKRAPDTWTESLVLDAARTVSLSPRETSFAPCIDGKDVETEIRGPEVTRFVSTVAQMPLVRRWVNELVQQTVVRRRRTTRPRMRAPLMPARGAKESP